MPALNWDLCDEFQVEYAKVWQDTHALALLTGGTGTKTLPLHVLLQNEVTDTPYARDTVTIAETPVYNGASDRTEFPSGSFSLEVNNAHATLPIQFQQVVLIKGGSANRPTLFSSAAVNATDDTITLNGHGLTEGERICFKPDAGATLPAPLAASSLYRAINVTANTFVPSTDGVAAVNLTNTGTGSFYLIYCKGIRVAIANVGSVVTISPGQGHTFLFNPLAFEHELT